MRPLERVRKLCIPGVRAALPLVVLVGAVALPDSAAASTYSDSVFATNPTAYWRLGDAAGSTAALDSANLQSGSYVGSPGLGTTGAPATDTDTGINVTAAGTRFSAPDRSNYANATTVEFWMRLNSYGDTTKYRAIASKGWDVSQRNWLIALGNNATGQLTYGYGAGGAAIGRRSVTNLALNQWYLVDYVRQAGKIQLYVNGALDGELTTSSTPVTSTAPVLLGDDGQTASFANSRYDEFALYDRPLTASEIAGHYTAGAAPASLCTKVAAPSGLDTNAGTAASPYKTAQKLVDSITSGQTGCLRAGPPYVTDKLTMGNAGTTLQAYPGDARPIVSGSVWLKGDRTTIQNLKLDGTTTTEPTSVTINGDYVAVRSNEITSGDKRICVIPSQYLSQRADHFLIERNRIHNCGPLSPRTNQDHGVYVDGDDGLIRNNAIYDNADRGVQFFPDAMRNVAELNTIDGNGEGVNFGGTGAPNSDYNVVRNNIVSNASQRWLVEASYPAGTPTLHNTVVGNCLYATNTVPYYNGNNGVSTEQPFAFTVSGSVVGDPLYANRAGKDFRLSATSPCVGKGAPADVTKP